MPPKMANFNVVFVAILLPLFQLIAGQTNHLPYFQDPAGHLRVRENAKEGTIVDSISAIDPEGQEITFSLDGIGDELFNIVDDNGVVNATGPSPLMRNLSLKKMLDREARSSYDFVLNVKDHFAPTGRKSFFSTTLIVLDVNDNSPVFLETPYVTSIEENTPSDHLFRVKAKDVDSSMSGSVLYSFTDDCKLADCELFSIAALTGIVKLNSNITLDYETRNRYTLDILAKDRGNPISLNSTTTLVVKVEDQSDQPPEFEKSSYRADIPEETSVNTTVVQTKAFDGDRGIDKPVAYAIVAGDDNHYFKIDNSTGTIYVNSRIDRDEGIVYFELTVEATEIPGNATGKTTVFITIRDVNDNKPTFRTDDVTYSLSTSLYQNAFSLLTTSLLQVINRLVAR